MVVRQPINRQEPVDVEALIGKGASVKSDVKLEEEYAYINLRVPVSLLRQVDECIKNRVGIKRTGWVLEAMQRAVLNE